MCRHVALAEHGITKTVLYYSIFTIHIEIIFIWIKSLYANPRKHMNTFVLYVYE